MPNHNDWNGTTNHDNSVNGTFKATTQIQHTTNKVVLKTDSQLNYANINYNNDVAISFSRNLYKTDCIPSMCGHALSVFRMFCRLFIVFCNLNDSISNSLKELEIIIEFHLKCISKEFSSLEILLRISYFSERKRRNCDLPNNKY